jgi:hypothetical protein
VWTVGCKHLSSFFNRLKGVLTTLSSRNILNWYSDASYHEFIDSMDKKAQAAMRVGTEVHECVSYTNSSRVDPIDSRYKGADRVSRLKALKKEYDPECVFTRELL